MYQDPLAMQHAVILIRLFQLASKINSRLECSGGTSLEIEFSALV
jgi:hypothetical protein